MDKEYWYFTFGCGKNYGDRQGKYVKIPGTYERARDLMILWYGKKWCGQYTKEEIDEMSKKYGVVEYTEGIDFEDID